MVDQYNALRSSSTRNFDTTVISNRLKRLYKKLSFLANALSGQTFGLAFGVNCDLKGRVLFRRRLWELCHTIVAKMLHRCYARVVSTKANRACLLLITIHGNFLETPL